MKLVKFTIVSGSRNTIFVNPELVAGVVAHGDGDKCTLRLTGIAEHVIVQGPVEDARSRN
jgi:hypothetical protein